MPKRSIIGSLLFLMFINDFTEEINSSIRLFVDDTSFYIVFDDPLKSAIKLNVGFSRIDKWASMWLVWCPESVVVRRRSDMSAHVLLNLFYKLGKLRNLSLFRNEFNKLNNTREHQC